MSNIWMNPPIVYDETSPRTQRTSKMIAIVSSIWEKMNIYKHANHTYRCSTSIKRRELRVWILPNFPINKKTKQRRNTPSSMVALVCSAPAISSSHSMRISEYWYCYHYWAWKNILLKLWQRSNDVSRCNHLKRISLKFERDSLYYPFRYQNRHSSPPLRSFLLARVFLPISWLVMNPPHCSLTFFTSFW